MKKTIDFLLDNRWLVFALLGTLIVSGIAVMVQLPIEAFPDLTNNQVVVTVQCPGMSPVEVEQLVTFPIETTMMGMPKMQTVRSDSKLGLSMVTIIFDDSMDRYLIRQLVSERLNQVRNQLPAGLEPQMGPMATAFGEVYQYTISAPKMTLMQIKTLQDWVIRYALLNIPGVSEVNCAQLSAALATVDAPASPKASAAVTAALVPFLLIPSIRSPKFGCRARAALREP